MGKGINLIFFFFFSFYVKPVTNRMHLLLAFLFQVGVTSRNLSARREKEENSATRVRSQLSECLGRWVQQQLVSTLLGK